jgi:hypothetical protein
VREREGLYRPGGFLVLPRWSGDNTTGRRHRKSQPTVSVHLDDKKEEKIQEQKRTAVGTLGDHHTSCSDFYQYL